MTALERLKQELRTITNLHGAASLMHWDQETNMPAGGGSARAEQIALLESLAHERLIAKETRSPLSELIDLNSGTPNAELTPEDQIFAREVWRDYHRAAALPNDFVEELARMISMAQQVWATARKENNYNKFAPYLEKIIRLKLREIEYLGEKDTPYDTLLDFYEPSMTSVTVSQLFNEMKERLVPLVQKIARSGVDIHQEILHRDYDVDQQWQFGMSILKDMGYDLNCGRQDTSAHPFTIELHPTDVRITTRLDKNNLLSGFSSTVHEGGHGLYEQGVDLEWYGTPFADAISYGIHESQSRLWENLIALSRPFWAHYYPKLQQLFPDNLKDVSRDTFYRAINTIKPSLIRVDADELTYNLHIMLRFEIERLVINDRVPVKELPAIWNDKMEAYLGIRPDSDANGILQDVHWSFGGFGYFPTYTLGNLYSVPILNQAKQDLSDFEDTIASGNLLELREWLRKNVHLVGRRKNAAELLKDLTGGQLSAKPFMDYLEDKYSTLYYL